MDLRKIQFGGYVLDESMADSSRDRAYFNRIGDEEDQYIEVFWPDETVLDNGHQLPLLIVQKTEGCEVAKTAVVNMYRFTDEKDDYKFIGDYLLEIIGEKE